MLCRTLAVAIVTVVVTVALLNAPAALHKLSDCGHVSVLLTCDLLNVCYPTQKVLSRVKPG